jgi:hypothetical protein
MSRGLPLSSKNTSEYTLISRALSLPVTEHEAGETSIGVTLTIS